MGDVDVQTVRIGQSLRGHSSRSHGSVWSARDLGGPLTNKPMKPPFSSRTCHLPIEVLITLPKDFPPYHHAAMKWKNKVKHAVSCMYSQKKTLLKLTRTATASHRSHVYSRSVLDLVLSFTSLFCRALEPPYFFWAVGLLLPLKTRY